MFEAEEEVTEVLFRKKTLNTWVFGPDIATSLAGNTFPAL